jgi:anaerobic magnesium-protoporphyrin IX monomethyl ester cyclase
MLKIIFINPYFYIGHPPLGFGYLSSYLKKYLNVPVEILLFDEMIDKDIFSVLREFKPDIIGISVVTPTFPRVKLLCKQIREITKAPIVAGGPHITAIPESILDTSIDVGVIGEGETTFLELVQCFLQSGEVRSSRIQGVVYVEQNRVVRTPSRSLIKDLDSIPPPDRSIFNMAYYSRPKRVAHGLYAKATSMMPSRGCPFGKCNFCSSYLIWGNIPRFFSPRYVVDEIEAIVNEYDLNFIIFLDDNFTTKLNWLESLSSLLKERGLNKKISFDCESISAFMNERKAEILKGMGCVRIEFGFESGSPRILNKLKSGRVRLEHNERAIEMCKGHDISILGNVVFGYIDETQDELKESAIWFFSHPIDYVAAHLYTPYPGTIGWKECVDRGIIDPQNIQWEQFATGSAEQNLIVNSVLPVDEFLKRYREICAEFTLRNHALVVDSGLSLVDKAKLYIAIAGDRDISLHMRPDHSIPGIYKYRLLSHVAFSVGSFSVKISALKHLIRTKGFKVTMRLIFNRLIPKFPLPCRLSFGAWWLAFDDVIDRHIRLYDKFEDGEQRFLMQFLEIGMTVLDIGAHHGLYTLLASKKVGSQGQVIAFEPSPRELRRLRWHLLLNRCRNIRVEPYALSSAEGIAELFVCLGRETGCNSLRLPAVSESIKKVSVSVTTLDSYLQRKGIDKVDFIKIDVEGAELGVLKRAIGLLTSSKPIIMCELADVRTQPWGYRSVEIYDLLEACGYRWFSITLGGKLKSCSKKAQYHENLIAVHKEKLPSVATYLEESGQKCESM